jgi:MoaA/NifB/PqqE/SkfB family radical SAM enzyme
LDEPSISKIESTARAILRLDPLAVVLTGGEPLVSPHLERALELLRDRAGIIVDTSGYVAKSKHLNLFKSFSAAVRVSIDAERPGLNDRYRPLCSGEVRTGGRSPSTLQAAIDMLCKAADLGLCVTVQSVAHKGNLADLEALGDKLFRLGVRAWRVLKVQPSQGKEKDYPKLVGSHRRYEHYFEQLQIAKRTRWGEKMAVQTTYNSVPNAVILVAPDGRFLTESNLGHGKIELDQDRPHNPRVSSIFPRVSPEAHAARYLNATSEKKI